MNETNLVGLLELGIGIAAFGLVAWLVMHVTRVTIPTMMESFERVNREQRRDFRDILEGERERFFTEMRIERERAGAMIEKALETIDEADAA